MVKKREGNEQEENEKTGNEGEKGERKIGRLRRILSFTKRGEEEKVQGKEGAGSDDNVTATRAGSPRKIDFENALEATRTVSPRAKGRGEEPHSPRFSDISKKGKEKEEKEKEKEKEEERKEEREEEREEEKEPYTLGITPGRMMAETIDSVLIEIAGKSRSEGEALFDCYMKDTGQEDTEKADTLPSITQKNSAIDQIVKCHVNVGSTLGITGAPHQARLKHPHVIVLTFDLIQGPDFETLIQMRRKADCYWQGVPIILVGSYSGDLEKQRSVTYKAAKSFADKINTPYFEVGLTTGENVQKAFSCAAYVGKEYREDLQSQASSPRQW